MQIHWTTQLHITQRVTVGPVMLIRCESPPLHNFLDFDAMPDKLRSVWPILCRQLETCNWVSAVYAWKSRAHSDGRKTENVSLLLSKRYLTVNHQQKKVKWLDNQLVLSLNKKKNFVIWFICDNILCYVCKHFSLCKSSHSCITRIYKLREQSISMQGRWWMSQFILKQKESATIL